MTGSAGQGEHCDTREPAMGPSASYCAVCGRPAAGIRRGSDVFCSEAHAEEFATEVAAARAAMEAGR